MALIGAEFSARELNATVLVRLDAVDLDDCEQKCLSRDRCAAMEFYVVGQESFWFTSWVHAGRGHRHQLQAD